MTVTVTGGITFSGGLTFAPSGAPSVTPTVEYLVVAGGGGGGWVGGGGAFNVSGATAGTPNTGGGGGGGGWTGTPNKAGGSGIVIIRYADTYSAATATTGSPTITTTGGYRVYKWTTVGSGSITF